MRFQLLKYASHFFIREQKKALDTVESFDLGIAGKTHNNLGNFVLHDTDATIDLHVRIATGP